MSKIEASLRELVREELEGRKPPPAPGRKLFFWLFLCVTNTAMLIWLLPETIFSNQRVETAGKFVAWLGSSIFVSCFVWFREQLLGLAQKRYFKWAQGLAFPVLLLLYLSQLNIFTIHPVIEPNDAELLVNGQNVAKEDREDLPLSISEHKIVIQPVGWNPNADPSEYPRPRQFKLRRSNVLTAWWGGEQPRWSLIYNVNVEVAGSVNELVVQRVERDFDAEFIAEPEPPLSQDTGESSVTNRTLVYKWHGVPRSTLALRLPHGKYEIYTQKTGCVEKLISHVQVPEGTLNEKKEPLSIELKEPCEPRSQ